MRDFIKIFEKNKFSERAIDIIKQTINTKKFALKDEKRNSEMRNGRMKTGGKTATNEFSDMVSQVSKESKFSRDKISLHSKSL